MLDLGEKRILLTGGGGFLGRHLRHALRNTGAHHIFAPRRREFDLTRATDIQQLFESVQPQVLIHAAAVVGGIGANMAEPGRFFYENAMMGVQLIEAAPCVWCREDSRARHDLRLPEVHSSAIFRRESLEWLPRGN